MAANLSELRHAIAPLTSEPRVVGACLVGSYARPSSVPDEQSDVDIVAILDDDADPKLGRTLLKQVRDQEIGPRIEMRILRRSMLVRLMAERTVYGAHLARDGQVLFDRGSGLAEFQALFPLDKPVAETAKHLRTRFSLYESVGWCNGEYLFCLSDLYAIGRSAVMLGLAQLGIFEFDRTRVFVAFEQRYESAASAAQTVHSLEPFYMYVRRDIGGVTQLPFSPHNCHSEANAARTACEDLLRTIK